jgi:SAM-dependent methyltransferase
VRRREWIQISAAFTAGVCLAPAQTKLPRELDVPFEASSPEIVQAMLKLAGVTKTDIVYDLGCGDGRIVVAAARNYGAHGVGIDIDPQRVGESRENARKAGVEHLVRFEEADFFKADIHEATVVALFLLPEINVQLRPKLVRELMPGARIVSNTFSMMEWKPDKEVEVNNGYFSRKVYLWIVPARQR